MWETEIKMRNNMCTHIHTDTHTYTLAHTRIHAHATHKHTRTHIHTHPYTQTHPRSQTHTYIYTHTHIHTYPYTQTYPHSHIYTHSHTYTHFYTHTHTHTHVQWVWKVKALKHRGGGIILYLPDCTLVPGQEKNCLPELDSKRWWSTAVLGEWFLIVVCPIPLRHKIRRQFTEEQTI